METPRVADANKSSFGLIDSPKRAWLALLLYTAGLYASLDLTYKVYVLVHDRIGRHRMSLLVNSFCVAVAVALVLYVAKRVPRSVGSYSALLGILGATGLLLRMERVPADRIHLIQYAPLAVLAFGLHRFYWHGFRVHAAALATVFLIGCGDEVLQSLLPNRHFDLHDIFLNTIAGVLALSLLGLVVRPGRRVQPQSKSGF